MAAFESAEREGVTDEKAKAYAAEVVGSLDGSPDPAKTVDAALSYIIGSGARIYGSGARIYGSGARIDEGGTPGGLDGAREPDQLLAQVPLVRGLSRTERADFTLISDSRQQELNVTARNYILAYADGDVQRVNGGFVDQGLGASGAATLPQRETYLVPRIDFVDLKDILEDLMARTDMGDIDRAYIWSQIVSAKGDSKTTEYENAQVYIDNRGVRDYLRDSHPTREWQTPNHLAVSFEDGYHAFGNGDSNSPGMGFVGRAEAYNRIQEREAGGIFGIGANPGDRQASMVFVDAIHAWRDAQEGQRFNAFARAWINGAIDPNYA